MKNYIEMLFKHWNRSFVSSFFLFIKDVESPYIILRSWSEIFMTLPFMSGYISTSAEMINVIIIYKLWSSLFILQNNGISVQCMWPMLKPASICSCSYMNYTRLVRDQLIKCRHGKISNRDDPYFIYHFLFCRFVRFMMQCIWFTSFCTLCNYASTHIDANGTRHYGCYAFNKHKQSYKHLVLIIIIKSSS